MSYFEKLDGLRCIAICMVLFEHTAPYLVSGSSFGYYGVDLFFVISGFLITKILLAFNSPNQWRDYFNFLGRRILRIFPLYYAVIILLWVIDFSVVRDYFGYLATYTFNYGIVVHGMPHNPIYHLWSLSVEEQFYLIWPPLVVLCIKKVNWLYLITIILIIVGYSQMMFNLIPSLAAYNYVGLPTRMASLSMGALASLIHVNYKETPLLLKKIYVEYVVVIVLLSSLLNNYQLKPLVLGCCSFYLVLKVCYDSFRIKQIAGFLDFEWVKYIGLISYGIYIIHKPLGALLLPLFDSVWSQFDFRSLGALKIIQWHSWLLKLPLLLIVTVACAHLSYRYFESKFLRLKVKLFPYTSS